MPKDPAPEGGIASTLAWSAAFATISVVVAAVYVPFRVAALVSDRVRRPGKTSRRPKVFVRA